MQSITILLKAFEPSLLCQAEEKILSRLPHILRNSSYSIRRLVDYPSHSATLATPNSQAEELRSDLLNGATLTETRSQHPHPSGRMRIPRVGCGSLAETRFSAIRLPQESKVWTLHRSPHGHSKSRETLRLSKYKSLIRICFFERSLQNHYAEPQAQADSSNAKKQERRVSIPKVALWISQIPGLYGVQIQLRWKSSQPITSSKCSAESSAGCG